MISDERIFRAAEETGVQVIRDSKFGRDEYTNIYSSAPALIRFARALLKEAGLEELKKDVENYLSVMAAAAVELNEHWVAHCDEEGYGPVNLIRRLEQGFPEHYGYRASQWEAVAAKAHRYDAVKSLSKEQLLLWRGAYGCSDEALDEFTDKK